MRRIKTSTVGVKETIDERLGVARCSDARAWENEHINAMLRPANHTAPTYHLFAALSDHVVFGRIKRRHLSKILPAHAAHSRERARVSNVSWAVSRRLRLRHGEGSRSGSPI